MELTELVCEECIVPELKGDSKSDVLREMMNTLAKTENKIDAEAALSAIMEREALGSTGVGEQVAIPHAKIADIEEVAIVIGVKRSGIEFDSADGKPVRLFFMLISPAKQMNIHLKTLAKISKLVKMTDFKERTMAEKITAEKIYAILREEESRLG
ncbi:MAG: PTS sugar transporter subunit IIA [Deferribacterales bacterium]